MQPTVAQQNRHRSPEALILGDMKPTIDDLPMVRVATLAALGEIGRVEKSVSSTKPQPRPFGCNSRTQPQQIRSCRVPRRRRAVDALGHLRGDQVDPTRRAPRIHEQGGTRFFVDCKTPRPVVRAPRSRRELQRRDPAAGEGDFTARATGRL